MKAVSFGDLQQMKNRVQAWSPRTKKILLYSFLAAAGTFVSTALVMWATMKLENKETN